MIKLRQEYDPAQLELLSKVMTHNYKGKLLTSLLTLDIIDDVEKDVAALGRIAEDVVPSFMRTLENILNVDLYIEGLDKIFYIPEYSDMNRAKTFMEMVSHKAELENMLLNRDSGVIITIGGEHEEEQMKNCSLITATYCVNGQCVGKLGVVGPTRMKYDEVSSVVEYLTDNLNEAFKMTEGE